MLVCETHYEVYFDGQLVEEGTLEDCMDRATKALDDDCAEVYKVTVDVKNDITLIEERIKI